MKTSLMLSVLLASMSLLGCADHAPSPRGVLVDGELRGVYDAEAVSDELAAANNSCQDHCGTRPARPAGCFCNDTCIQYGDCCPDFQQICSSTPPPRPPSPPAPTGGVIHIDPVNGINSNPGTASAPMRSLSWAVTHLNGASEVRIAAGNTDGAEVPSNVNVYGGYAPGFASRNPSEYVSKIEWASVTNAKVDGVSFSQRLVARGTSLVTNTSFGAELELRDQAAANSVFGVTAKLAGAGNVIVNSVLTSTLSCYATSTNAIAAFNVIGTRETGNYRIFCKTGNFQQFAYNIALNNYGASCIWDDYSRSTIGNNNIEASCGDVAFLAFDPKFRNEATNDYRLTTDSRCEVTRNIQAALPTPLAAYDRSGNLRTAPYSYGAHEWDGACL